MAKGTKDKGIEVKTYPTHHVITQPNPLRKVLRRVVAETDLDDPVARAEAALDRLSGEFAGWMYSECDRLEAARQVVAQQGFSKETHDEMFRAAHDIRGEASTFGFPSVAGAAGSGCESPSAAPS